MLRLCLPCVLSSRCHGLFYNLWLWYLLVILASCLKVQLTQTGFTGLHAFSITKSYLIDLISMKKISQISAGDINLLSNLLVQNPQPQIYPLFVCVFVYGAL